MKTLTLKTGTDTDFFKRGKVLAKLADKGGKLPEESIVSFEDPADLLHLLTANRLALFKAIKEQPGPLSELSNRLQRGREAIRRDVGELAKAGLVTLEIQPGQDRMVRASARSFRLEARLG